jgi:predicted amidohydrolase YtcJ
MSTLYADLIIRNANIYTINPRQAKARSLAIRDGKFVAVGHDTNGLEGPGTHILDLQGKTVLPGFIDAHCHVLSSGTRHVMQVDTDLRSIGAIQQDLKERAQKTPAGQWVLGFKFDDTKTDEKRFLTRQDLDAITADHPLMVAHQAGHVYFFNSKGLEAAGFRNETEDPPGGRLGRDESTGHLNGQVYGRAIERVLTDVLPEPGDDDWRRGLDLMMGMFASHGITSAHDAMVSSGDLRIYQEARDNSRIPMRLYLLMFRDHFPALRDAGVKTGLGDTTLRIGGIKMVSDGAIATRTAYLSQPYVGSCCNHGIRNMTSEETESRVLDMHKAGFQVCIHSNGDAAIDMVLTAYEKAQKAFPRPDPRHRIEHCSVVNPSILKRMKTAGVTATPFCSYVYYHGEKMPFYGEERLEWMFAQRSFIDYGVNSTGASDYPCSPMSPLMGIQSCVTRQDSSGRAWGPSQRITVGEAFRLYTINGAYASFEEKIKGSIEVGKLGDLVVLGADPVRVDPHTIKDIPVEMTIVGGRIVYQR